ncbi:unnamed protein product [Staurois parvus]|uniref:Uncharacterized protein n=1 Tax=Staurois parvus TaxID=386267 RepID=A0ABN9ER09_9NEOB|nr:unnamed protein product [Staurois parvus]
MALGRKGLTSGAIKGLTVCWVCFTMGLCLVLLGGCLLVLHCNHTALDGCAVHKHPEQQTKQSSFPSEMLGNHQAPAGNHCPGPGD